MNAPRTKNLFVNLTQENINKGRKAPGRCPLENALRDLGFKKVNVGFNTFSFTVDRQHYSGDLTKKAQGFVTRYEKGGKRGVTPDTFRLRARV